jgi:hypothetical protein
MNDDPKHTEWPEMLMTRRNPSRRPSDMSAFRGCKCGCQSEWMPYVPIHSIRKRLQAMIDGEQELYNSSAASVDQDGMQIHGATLDAFRQALAAFPEQEEEG